MAGNVVEVIVAEEPVYVCALYVYGLSTMPMIDDDVLMR